MGKTLQVRNVPEAVHRTLRERAARAGTSLSDYVLGELERIAARPLVSEVLDRAASRHGGVSSTAIVESVRAERDRR